MGFLGLGEPSLGTLIIFLGAWINRDFTTPVDRYAHERLSDIERSERPVTKIEPVVWNRQDRWRQREISVFGFRKVLNTPNTAVFQNRLLSRLLLRFPFLVEIVYWGLIYSVYQMGRAMLAERLRESTVDVACHHALQVIRLEERLHIFWEPAIQRFFLQYPGVMYWVNRIYSYVHLPATVTFLVGLYWFAITRNRTLARWRQPASGPYLYESKRRSLAVSDSTVDVPHLAECVDRFAIFLPFVFSQLGHACRLGCWVIPRHREMPSRLNALALSTQSTGEMELFRCCECSMIILARHRFRRLCSIADASQQHKTIHEPIR